ncbi:hypothetical protein ACJMK2_038289, partial [Sinanodonta woodiana]
MTTIARPGMPVASISSLEGTPRTGRLSASRAVVSTDPDERRLPDIRTSDNAMDKSKPLPTSLQSDFIPEDVLFALTQPTEIRDKLGPPNRARNLAVSDAPARKVPANVWNFKRREKFKHLTEDSICICGAGRDISFLYDVPKSDAWPQRPERIDKTVIRKEAGESQKQALQLPDTLIPEEYHIVKNKGVMGIEFHEDKYSTQIQDHEKHLSVFPSLKPTSRFEVKQLRKTMEDMLERAGVNDADLEIRGPTQMHNLLELIKKEQDIYNIIFHELIRQTSVECIERGELLADLRKKYSDLLNKVPQQIKSLHEEVMAQRALDRRLTEELMRFKSTISILTSELTEVKEHDKRVTKEAQQAQEDLKFALKEAEKNASLLAEYHELYELQRKRLEGQVFILTDEREIWSNAAYCLAMKVTEEAQLITAKRLHVSEKAWVKLATHFTILLSDRDTDLLTKIQTHLEKWRNALEEFSIILKHREEEMRTQLLLLAPGIEKWMKEIRKLCLFDPSTAEGLLQKAPDEALQQALLQEIRKWEESLGHETEKFGGDVLLSGQEQLTFIRQQMEGWTEHAMKVFGRHRGEEGRAHPDQEVMGKMNELIDGLLKQFNARLTGENGVATLVIHLMNGLETWDMKITAGLNGTMAIHDTEWIGICQLMEDWLNAIQKAIEYVGTTQREDDRNEGRPHTRIEVAEVVRKVQKWVTTATNAVDSEDAKLVEQVIKLHSEMVRWMVQVLLRLAPDKKGNSKEASEMALLSSTTISQLHQNAKTLFEQLESFSKYVSLCCGGIVLENTQERRDKMEEDAEHELKDLQRLLHECEDWINTAKILTCQLMGESMEKLFPDIAGVEGTSHRKDLRRPGTIAYTDMEKLEQPATQEVQPAKEADKEVKQAVEETKVEGESPQNEDKKHEEET